MGVKCLSAGAGTQANARRHRRAGTGAQAVVRRSRAERIIPLAFVVLVTMRGTRKGGVGEGKQWLTLTSLWL